jgi:NAD(P)H dehydrogenase (quinone)
MSKVLITYFSKTGNTEEMARYVAEGVKAEGLEVEIKPVQKAKVEDLLSADGIILGSPTYYGIISGPLKNFIDESIKYHGKLAGKVGGAFATSGVLGCGNETTALDIIKAMLVHGMIIPGDVNAPYGAVAVGKPDAESKTSCKELGKRVSKLVKQLSR